MRWLTTTSLLPDFSDLADTGQTSQQEAFLNLTHFCYYFKHTVVIRAYKTKKTMQNIVFFCFWVEENFPAHLHVWEEEMMTSIQMQGQSNIIYCIQEVTEICLVPTHTWSLINHPVASWRKALRYEMTSPCRSSAFSSCHWSCDHTMCVIRYAPLDWLLLFWISHSLCRTLFVLNGKHPFCRLTEAGRIIHGRLQRATWLKIYENVSLVKIV